MLTNPAKDVLASSRGAAKTAAMTLAGQPLAGRRVLIIVENLSVPFDRRVWNEARALKMAGAEVCVICPTGKGSEGRYEELEGIRIYRHPLPIEASGALGYLLEYGGALFWETLLAWRIFLSRGFDRPPSSHLPRSPVL